jgi:hypothetical protein
MTYKELLEFLASLSPEQLNQTVTVFDSVEEEYYPLASISFTDVVDVLDANHAVLEF